MPASARVGATGFFDNPFADRLGLLLHDVIQATLGRGPWWFFGRERGWREHERRPGVVAGPGGVMEARRPPFSSSPWSRRPCPRRDVQALGLLPG